MSLSNVSDLNRKNIHELMAMANELHVEHVGRAKKHDIIFSIMQAQAKQGIDIMAQGILEIVSDGYGFIRYPESSYQPGPDDIYVSPNVVRKCHLKTGDDILGLVRAPKQSERYFALAQIKSINGTGVDKKRPHEHDNFENKTPTHPNERIRLERGNGSTEDITARMIDLVAPIGKGQRALIVSPPKAGKTMMLQNIAHAINKNHPECSIIVLLIDERPEEVTEMKRMVKGEVVASTFDESASRHVHLAELVISKAKRMVEKKQDVVILLDSITRLARAYNTVTPSSGKVLTGGVDANALQRPKRFFGAARNHEEGGSLTIIATALVETGSRMDDIIYEEFKGTGNNEIHLNRNIAEKRVFPAINVTMSGTRREELITTEDELRKMWILRKYLHPMENNATEFLINKLKSIKTNTAFFEAMLKGEKA